MEQIKQKRVQKQNSFLASQLLPDKKLTKVVSPKQTFFVVGLSIRISINFIYVFSSYHLWQGSIQPKPTNISTEHIFAQLPYFKTILIPIVKFVILLVQRTFSRCSERSDILSLSISFARVLLWLMIRIALVSNINQSLVNLDYYQIKITHQGGKFVPRRSDWIWLKSNQRGCYVNKQVLPCNYTACIVSTPRINW